MQLLLSRASPAVTVSRHSVMGCKMITQQFRIHSNLYTQRCTHSINIRSLSKFHLTGVAHISGDKLDVCLSSVSSCCLLRLLNLEGNRPNKQLHHLSGVFSPNKEQVEVSRCSTTAPPAHVYNNIQDCSRKAALESTSKT